MGYRFLDKTAKIELTDVYTVRLEFDGQVWEKAELRRMFPISDRDNYISVIDSDEHEIAMIRSYDDLTPDSAAAVKACFNDYYLIPKILKITECSDKTGMLKITAETDHGITMKKEVFDRKKQPQTADAPDALREDLIEGRNALTEALRSGRSIDKLYVAEGSTDRSLARLAAQAKEAGAVVVPTDRRKLDQMSPTGAHQGVIAAVAAHEYASVDEILELAAQRGEAPLLVICDELSDPHNLGAILRTAECAGAHGVIIPKRRSVGLTAVVAKTSAGAVEYLPVARVSNVVNTIRELKDKGVWIYGTAADADSGLYRTDLTGPAAIVIGNEGEGMSRLVRESCDVLVSIPMKGKISSLNASAAAAVLLYEALRQRQA